MERTNDMRSAWPFAGGIGWPLEDGDEPLDATRLEEKKNKQKLLTAVSSASDRSH